jgi:hypothetical protein
MSNEYYIIECPHCNGEVFIYRIEIACRIFRHGVYKCNNEQISPHASKEECDRLINGEEIYGCGGPFKVRYDEDGKLIGEKCGYI